MPVSHQPHTFLSPANLAAQNSEEDIEWVRIKSDDGFSFLLDKRAIECSGTLKDMLDG
jgi:hypothetical protein